jgi:hypothetical protein
MVNFFLKKILFRIQAKNINNQILKTEKGKKKGKHTHLGTVSMGKFRVTK